MMKGFLIILCFVASVYGGTRKAEPGESKKALSLWKKYCEGGKEGGVDGETTFIHCKHPLGPVTRDINGGEIDAETRNAEEQRTQYIFVQPAPLHFNHNLQVKTSSALEPKTVIYVRPAETSHSYNPEILKGPEPEHEKPELVFLEGPGRKSSKDERSEKVVSGKESEEEGEKPEEIKTAPGKESEESSTKENKSEVPEQIKRGRSDLEEEETEAEADDNLEVAGGSPSPRVVFLPSRPGLDNVVPSKKKEEANKPRPARGIFPSKNIPLYTLHKRSRLY